MTSFTVKSAVKTGDKPDKGYGPMQSIQLVLQEYGTTTDLGAEWYTKATTAVPTAGAVIEGTIEPSQYGPKFKKAQAGGTYQGGGGRGGRSPEETKSIVRQHSQHMALLYTKIKADLGQLPESWGMAEVRTIIDWFDADATDGWKPPLEGEVRS